jgi:CBS domain-containing protein
MTTAPAVVRSTLTVRELIECFERDDVHSYPVVEADRTLRGIVTKLDVLRVFRPESTGLEIGNVGDRRVADIMRPGVFTLQPDDPLFVAIDLMIETRLRSLPVVERPRGMPPVLVGMVSQGDVLRGLMAESAPTPS